MINLISDTVTIPTSDMLNAMMSAAVGDDVFGEDPSVKRLEEKVATLFGHEAALFCPTGTMSNQIAIKCHTQPMDEMVCDISSHVYQYENGGYALHSGIAVQLLPGVDGIITPEQIRSGVKPVADWLPRTRLVVIENSANRAGGNYYSFEQMKEISDLCCSMSLRLHLDGARIFNVLVETGDDPAEVGNLFDSVSVCLSKGLGAPAGTVLAGNNAFITQARRWRKAMGGGMRQSGYLAAAGIYALDHHVNRLREDNAHASRIGQVLARCSYVAKVRPVKTNIVIFDLQPTVDAGAFIQYLRENDINASAFGTHMVRFVFHLGISSEMVNKVEQVISNW
jgi:threonine aldolase